MLKRRFSAAFEDVATPSPGRPMVTPPTRHPQPPRFTPSADKATVPRATKAVGPSESEILKLQLQQMQEAMQAQSLLLAQLTQQSQAAAASSSQPVPPPASHVSTDTTPEPAKQSPAKAPPKVAATPKKAIQKKSKALRRPVQPSQESKETPMTTTMTRPSSLRTGHLPLHYILFRLWAKQNMII